MTPSHPPFRLFERDTEHEFAEEISARMIAGQCVVGEPAPLSEAQIIVQANPEVLPLQNVSNYPLQKNVLHLNLPPKRAARLSIYRVQNGNVEEVVVKPRLRRIPCCLSCFWGRWLPGKGASAPSKVFFDGTDCIQSTT